MYCPRVDETLLHISSQKIRQYTSENVVDPSVYKIVVFQNKFIFKLKRVLVEFFIDLKI